MEAYKIIDKSYYRDRINLNRDQNFELYLFLVYHFLWGIRQMCFSTFKCYLHLTFVINLQMKILQLLPYLSHILLFLIEVYYCMDPTIKIIPSLTLDTWVRWTGEYIYINMPGQWDLFVTGKGTNLLLKLSMLTN